MSTLAANSGLTVVATKQALMEMRNEKLINVSYEDDGFAVVVVN
jgi:hypothetical protein